MTIVQRLFVAALLAMVIVVVRAQIQDITIDEADTYLFYVARGTPTHWDGASNNHVLNSLLMRLFICVFGVSHLAARAPALIGAAVYIASAARLSYSLARGQLVVFCCLVLNPFVLDHLVAARGYSLALGCWLCAVMLFALYDRPEWASALLALSFAANFSFAFLDAATLAVGWVWRRQPVIRLVLPGLVVTALFSLPALAGWPRGQLWDGASSMTELVTSVVASSLYEPNRFLVNPLLYRPVEWAGRLSLAGLVIASVFAVRRSGVPALARAAAAVLALTLLAHWLGFRFFHLLLPRNRTAVYLAPLVILTAGAMARSRAVRAMLGVLACYFVLCVRLTYFREWAWDRDVRHAYDAIAWVNHEYGIRNVPSKWMYVAALNFYRSMSGRESFAEFVGPEPLPAGGDAYVLHGVLDREFIDREGLVVVYRGEPSEVVVAVRSHILAPRSISSGTSASKM